MDYDLFLCVILDNIRMKTLTSVLVRARLYYLGQTDFLHREEYRCSKTTAKKQ